MSRQLFAQAFSSKYKSWTHPASNETILRPMIPFQLFFLSLQFLVIIWTRWRQSLTGQVLHLNRRHQSCANLVVSLVAFVLWSFTGSSHFKTVIYCHFYLVCTYCKSSLSFLSIVCYSTQGIRPWKGAGLKKTGHLQKNI